jgi:iron complex outermembrane receptor protein
MPTPRSLFFGAASIVVLAATEAFAQSPARTVTIPAEDLGAALDAYIRQSGVQLIYDVDDVRGATSRAVNGAVATSALSQMLDGTGLAANRDVSGAVIIARVVPPPARPELSIAESVVVTGSRIRNANEPSTPVLSLATDQLRGTTPGGVPEALNKMPIFVSGSTPNNATTGANGRGNNAPGYFLNLRGLGAIRTLILEDGHRVPGTFYDATVDVDMLPQMLVQRVEVVTGGASAVYGSDAVTGVVNFILDKNFTGLKGEMQAGISGYGDAKNVRLGVAGGEDLAGGHLIWSMEYRNRAALPDAAARPLGNLGTSIVGAGTAGSPYALVTNIRQSNTAPGGLIASGPGAGMQFLNDGSLAAFNPGLPTATRNFAIGGDGGILHNEYLLPAFNTGQAFAYYSRAFGDVTAHLEARYAQARSHEAGQIFTNINGSGISTNGAGAQYPITIHRQNDFLTPGEQAFLFPVGGPDSFQMNRMDNDLMSRLSLDQHTGALAIGVGLNGRLDGDWAWDFNYTHGKTRTRLSTRGNIDTARFYAALDAVRDPATGNVVCNVTLTAPGAFPGCVPLNLFGQSATTVNGSNASQAALNYVAGTTWWTAHNGLDDFSANITGALAEGWAGPIKAAFGTEYRLASLNVVTSTPDNSFNSQSLRLAPPGTFASTAASPQGTFPPTDLANFKEVLAGARGSANISEANIELEIPLLRNLPGVTFLSVNGAARYTEYHVAGQDPTGSGRVKNAFSASTWKLGGEWQVNDDVRLRATQSRDIRAPTLWDLFQGPVTTTSGVSDSLTGVSGSANTQFVGNPALKPEVADNTTAGLVYQPARLPNLRLTADYFHITIAREIANVSGAGYITQSLCLNSDGSSPFCGLIQRPISYNSTSPLNFPTLYYSRTANFQTQWTEGVDFEADYRAVFEDWAGPSGTLDLRLLWTHTSFLKTLGLPGSVITNLAGSADAPGSAEPTDKGALMITWKEQDITLDFMERYYSALRPSFNPSLVYDASVGRLAPWFQTDINISHNLMVGGVPASISLNVSNLLDAKPGIYQTPNYTGSPGMNYPVVPYEDIIGRSFALGLTLRLD